MNMSFISCSHPWLKVLLSPPVHELFVGWEIGDLLCLLQEFHESDNLFLHSLDYWAVSGPASELLANLHKFCFNLVKGVEIEVLLSPCEHFLEVLVRDGGVVECLLVLSNLRVDEGLDVFLDLIEIFKKMCEIGVVHVLEV